MSAMSRSICWKSIGTPSASSRRAGLGRKNERRCVRTHFERRHHVRLIDAVGQSDRPDPKMVQVIGSKGCDHGHIRRIPAAHHLNAADPGRVVARIKGVPAPVQKDLEPGAEIGGTGFLGTDIGDVSADIACRNVHRAAQGEREMREIPAHARFF